MKKVKRLICIIMTVFILVIAPVNSYNQVQAMELVGSMEILQALLEIFGVTAGLGNQSDFFSQSSFDDFAAAVSNGKVYHMDQYGDVDFSDNDSVMNWLEWADGIDEYITTSGRSPVTKYDITIKAGAGVIDYVLMRFNDNDIHNAIQYKAKKLRQFNPEELADAYYSDPNKYMLVDVSNFTLLDEETGEFVEYSSLADIKNGGVENDNLT